MSDATEKPWTLKEHVRELENLVHTGKLDMAVVGFMRPNGECKLCRNDKPHWTLSSSQFGAMCDTSFHRLLFLYLANVRGEMDPLKVK